MTTAELRTLALSAIEAAGKATPLEDTGHGQTCRCEACQSIWKRASEIHFHSQAVVKIVPDLARALLASLDANEELRRLARREHRSCDQSFDETYACSCGAAAHNARVEEVGNGA